MCAGPGKRESGWCQEGGCGQEEGERNLGKEGGKEGGREGGRGG